MEAVGMAVLLRASNKNKDSLGLVFASLRVLTVVIS